MARSQVETWLRRKVDASDLVQETMLEACRDFERFEGCTEQEWLAWLRKIMAHNAADFVRRYRGTAKRAAGREVPFRDPADSHSPGAPEPAAPQLTPSQEFLQLDTELRVTAALSELPPDYQEVIVLRNLATAVLQRSGRADGPLPPGRADAVDAGDTEVAGGDGRKRRMTNGVLRSWVLGLGFSRQ